MDKMLSEKIRERRCDRLDEWSMDELARDVEKLEAALTPSPWIPCSERLPTEADGDYNGAVWVAEDGVPRLDGWRWVGNDAWRDKRGITHWKPTGLVRPEPPEGE